MEARAQQREREAERHPQEGEQRVGRRRAAGEAAVVEDGAAPQLLPGHRAVLPPCHDVRFLHSRGTISKNTDSACACMAIRT